MIVTEIFRGTNERSGAADREHNPEFVPISHALAPSPIYAALRCVILQNGKLYVAKSSASCNSAIEYSALRGCFALQTCKPTFLVCKLASVLWRIGVFALLPCKVCCRPGDRNCRAEIAACQTTTGVTAAASLSFRPMPSPVRLYASKALRGETTMERRHGWEQVWRGHSSCFPVF